MTLSDFHFCVLAEFCSVTMADSSLCVIAEFCSVTMADFPFVPKLSFVLFCDCGWLLPFFMS